MIITNKIQMDLLTPGDKPQVDVMQDDRYSRRLQISLFAEGEAYSLPEGSQVLLSFQKPDGHGGFYDTLPDGRQAWALSGNTVTLALAPQVCTVAGTVQMSVSFIKEAVQLSTFAISLQVRPRPGNFAESEDYYYVRGFLPQPAEAARPGQLLQVSVVDAAGYVRQVKAVDAAAGEGGADGADGEDGGYYTPSVTQPQPGYMKVSYTASKSDMPELYDSSIELPHGQDGVSPTISVEAITGGHRVTITDAAGSQSFDIMDGQDGAGAAHSNAIVAGTEMVADLDAAPVNTVCIFNPATAENRPDFSAISSDVGWVLTTRCTQSNGVNMDTQITVYTASGKMFTRQGMNGNYSMSEWAEISGTSNAPGNTSSDGTLPDYWTTHLATQVRLIRSKMAEAGRNKSAFLFYTDAHWNSGKQMAPDLLKYLYENTAINKTIFGGDIVNDEPDDDTVDDDIEMAYLWDWRKAIRDLPNHHSVVGNHDDGNTNTATGGATNSVFNSDYVYAYLMAPEETSDIVRGGDFFYYIDSPNEKTRYLYLDTGFLGQFNLGTEQTNFINESLKSTPANWHIVVISHIWYMPDYSQYSQRPVPLTGLSTAAAQLVTILDNYNARNGDFSACAAKVEFCMGGHIHYDYVDKTPGGIPIILCETDGSGIRGSYTYTAGTTSEAAVSAVIADYDANKISVIRVGRGEGYTVTITEPSANYTNMIPLSTDTDGSIYNGVGYKDQTRISGADGVTLITDGTDKHSWVTGFIPINNGDVVRIANYFPSDRSAGEGLYVLGLYNEDKSWNRMKRLSDLLDTSFLATAATLSGTGYNTLLTFTFTGGSSAFNNAKYMRLISTCIERDASRLDSIEKAVVTINEEIT